MLIGVIRVITLSSQEEIDKHGKLIEGAFPGTETVSRCIENQPKGIYNKSSKKKAIPKILEVARGLQDDSGVDAIFVSCADDPGVHKAREQLEIPVVGAGESLAAVSRSYSHSIGVLTITPDPPEPLRDSIKEYIVRTVQIAEHTLNLEGPESYEQAADEVRSMEEEGIGAISLGCTGFSTIGMSRKLGKVTGVPVIDPVIAGGSVLYTWKFSKGDKT